MGPAPLVSLYIFGLRQAEVDDRKSRLLAYFEEMNFDTLRPSWHTWRNPVKLCQSCSFFKKNYSDDDYENNESYDFMQLISYAFTKKFFDGYMADSRFLEGRMHERRTDKVIVARGQIAELIAKACYYGRLNDEIITKKLSEGMDESINIFSSREWRRLVEK